MSRPRRSTTATRRCFDSSIRSISSRAKSQRPTSKPFERLAGPMKPCILQSLSARFSTSTTGGSMPLACTRCQTRRIGKEASAWPPKAMHHRSDSNRHPRRASFTRTTRRNGETEITVLFEAAGMPMRSVVSWIGVSWAVRCIRSGVRIAPRTDGIYVDSVARWLCGLRLCGLNRSEAFSSPVQADAPRRQSPTVRLRGRVPCRA